jgi:hypothetical protein
MSNRNRTPQHGDTLHSSAVAFEVRHQTGASSERGRAAQRLGHGFTRRCGVRAPTDQSLCMYAFGHHGRHAWEPALLT